MNPTDFAAYLGISRSMLYMLIKAKTVKRTRPSPDYKRTSGPVPKYVFDPKDPTNVAAKEYYDSQAKLNIHANN